MNLNRINSQFNHLFFNTTPWMTNCAFIETVFFAKLEENKSEDGKKLPVQQHFLFPALINNFLSTFLFIENTFQKSLNFYSTRVPLLKYHSSFWGMIFYHNLRFYLTRKVKFRFSIPKSQKNCNLLHSVFLNLFRWQILFLQMLFPKINDIFFKMLPEHILIY